MDWARVRRPAGHRRPDVGQPTRTRWPISGAAARHLGAAYRAQADIVTTYAALYPDEWAVNMYPRGGFAGGAALTALAERLIARLAAERCLPLLDGVWGAGEDSPSPVPWLPWFVFSIPIDGDQGYHSLYEYEGQSYVSAALILFEWVVGGCFEMTRDIPPFLHASAATLGPEMEGLLSAVMEEADARCADRGRPRAERPDDLLVDDPAGLFSRRTDALRHVPVVARYAMGADDNVFLACHGEWWRLEAAEGYCRWLPDVVMGLAQEWAAARVVQEATIALWEELSRPPLFAQLLSLLAAMLGLPVAAQMRSA